MINLGIGLLNLGVAGSLYLWDETVPQGWLLILLNLLCGAFNLWLYARHM